MGFENTAALKGGLEAWAAAGNPTVLAGQERH